MECFVTFLLFSISALWIAGSGARRYSTRRRQRQLLAQLARQFGGMYLGGGLFSKPSMRCRYGETWAVASIASPLGSIPGPCLQVRIHWPHTAVRCELISRTESDPPRAPGRHWQRVDSAEGFSNRHDVFAPDVTDAQQLLTSGVRWQFERLSSVGPSRQLHVLIREGVILVQKPWPNLRGEHPAQFVQGALELYDQCMLAKATGIQFLHADEAQTLEHVLCKVCGEEIHEQMVVCRRCKTPHHQDCWQYTGGCSVFGCRETQYLQPPVGRA